MWLVSLCVTDVAHVCRLPPQANKSTGHHKIGLKLKKEIYCNFSPRLFFFLLLLLLSDYLLCCDTVVMLKKNKQELNCSIFYLDCF